MRWLKEMAAFQMEVQHKPGRINLKADAERIYWSHVGPGPKQGVAERGAREGPCAQEGPQVDAEPQAEQR